MAWSFFQQRPGRQVGPGTDARCVGYPDIRCPHWRELDTTSLPQTRCKRGQRAREATTRNNGGYLLAFIRETSGRLLSSNWSLRLPRPGSEHGIPGPN